MGLTATDKGGQDFEPLPIGMHHAICYAIIDLGTQPQNNPKFRETPKVMFIWEVPGERIEIEKDGVKKNLPRAISREFTVSLSQKSNLRPMLESWRSRPFTEEELKGFNIGKVAGANCLLNIVHDRKNDKTYANVAAVNPLMKNMQKKTAENPLLVFELDAFLKTGAADLPLGIPDWIKGKIMDSHEWTAVRGGGSPDRSHETEQSSQGNQDEDVPF